MTTADVRSFLAGPGRDLRTADLARARVDNPAWESASLRVLIVRLSRYGDVDRSTPHLFLAQEARRAGTDILIDFCFLPGRDDAALLASHGVPPLYGCTTAAPVAEFDLVLVSCAFVLELLNLPVLLAASGLPVMASARADARPAFVLGGSSALAAQAIIGESGDAMVDAIFFGEGEGHVERLVRLFADSRGASRHELLRSAAADMPGLWPVGTGTVPVRASACYAPGARELVTTYPVLPGPEAATARLQISYGCPFACTFCFEGWGRKPYREVPREELLVAARALKLATGARSLELSSFNFNTHREIVPLITELNRLFADVSFMSQRVDILADTRGLLEAEMAAGKRSFTVGVEGVSERQRLFMDKRLDERRLRKVLSAMLDAGAREIKLFYLLSGYESEEDFAEFRAFLEWVRGQVEATRNRTRIVFSFNRLIRMPFTPLQFDPLLLEQEQWQDVIRSARAAVGSAGYEFRLTSSWPEHALCQVLALGGRWLCDALQELAAAGHTYEDEARAETWEALRAWMAANARRVAADALAAEKPADYGFPLGFVDAATTQAALHTRYLAARAALRAKPAAVQAAAAPPAAGAGARRVVLDGAIAEVRSVVKAKAALPVLPIAARLPRAVAGMGPEELAAWAARELMAADPSLIDDLLEVRELRLGTLARENAEAWVPTIPWFGETVLGLVAWRQEPLAAALGRGVTTPGGLALIAATPGAVAAQEGPPPRLRLSLELSDADFPQAGPRLADALNAAHVPVTVRRDGAGYRLEPAARARRVVTEASYRLDGGLWRMQLTVGQRFALVPFLRGFGRHAERRAVVELLPLES
jgi:radical SAM superfamily enzyme YgiQ (UPF0313 family)